MRGKRTTHVCAVWSLNGSDNKNKLACVFIARSSTTHYLTFNWTWESIRFQYSHHHILSNSFLYYKHFIARTLSLTASLPAFPKRTLATGLSDAVGEWRRFFRCSARGRDVPASNKRFVAAASRIKKETYCSATKAWSGFQSTIREALPTNQVLATDSSRPPRERGLGQPEDLS